jgi:WD40 repeat protein
MSLCKSRVACSLVGGFMVLLLNVQPCEAQEPNLETLWADLADTDAGKAYRAIWALALTPEKAVPFLKARLQPASGDRKQIDKLIRDLESQVFAVRDKAAADLERLSDAAEEALRQALQGKPGLELKRRVEILLARISESAGSPALVRQERALEALESAGTQEARELVKRLADGYPAARWTQMAKATHARLAGRAPFKAMPAKKVDEFGDELPPGTLARLGTIRLQNGYWAAITPDGKSLITASDKSLHAWDMTTGRAMSGFPQAKDWPDCRAVAVSPDGKLLAVAYDRAYSFDICELPSGKLLHRQRGKGETLEPCRYSIAFCADSKNFVVTSQWATQICAVATGKKIREFSHPRGFFHSVTSADGRRLATSSSRGIWIWDVADGKLLHDLGDQKWHVFYAAMNADGTRLASYGPGPSVRIWDADKGKMIRQLPLVGDPVHGDPVPTFAFSPDGATLALTDCVAKGDPEQRIQMWSLANLDLKPRILTPPPGVGQIEAFTPDGKTLLWRTGSSYRLLDSATGKDRHGWVSRGAILGVAWSPGGSRIATAGQDGTVGLWDAGNAKLLHTLIGHRRGIETVVFSPDSRLLVSCGAHKEPAILWDAVNGKKKAELGHYREKVPGVLWAGFSADSKFVYTGGYGPRGVFETATGKLHGEFHTDRISTWNMAFSADGRFAALGIDFSSIYDLSAKKMIKTVDSNQCVAHAFSFDARTLAVLNNAQSNRDVVLWEVLTGRERARFALPKSYHSSGRLAFSPDGRLLAAVTPWYSVESFHLWDLVTGKKLGPFPGHLDHVVAVAFSPDSRRMATASNDGTVLIREIQQK